MFVRVSKKGSIKRDLRELSLDVFQFCSKNSISIEIEWICRESNTKADMISNFIDIDDWRISFELLYLLQDRRDKLDVDWSTSSYYNAKPQGWTPSQKTGEEYLAYLYHLLFWCQEFAANPRAKDTWCFGHSPFGPQGFLGSFMHGPEGIYQANYRLDGSVHFQRFLCALYVWSVCFGTEDLFCYGGIESELTRFMYASCVRITFQLGQCCQDHIFVYGDNYKRCYLITFCY